MSNFIVSARKYRPAKFVDVVGQEHITNTLKNALKNNHLAHSFLFCGPRGVGKTTCARILAKTINCTNITPDFEACNECESCTSFNSNSSFNIHELDAASNNSVEDIRALTDQVRFAPQAGKYKIYIIDEVHMLSAAAFNAFLKTLEEPPHYAIFILATTEKHKIIPTILSRCQIFDFRRIPVDTIVTHLDTICKTEGITAESNGLHIIAQKADGGLRDALSMFDRLVSFAGKNMTYNDILSNLNVLDHDYFFKVTDALLSQNIADALLLFDEIQRNGFDGDDFILGLGEHFRNLFVAKEVATAKLLEVSGNLKERYLAQANIAPINFLVNALRLSNECDINYRMSKNKRLTVEIALTKMCYIKNALTVSSSPNSAGEAKKK
jgi:DNA polymerase-3 subunit gamma/tau